MNGRGGSENRGGGAARRARLPWWKRAVFAGVLALVSLLTLAAVEGLLRLAGFGGYPPTFRIAGTLPNGARLVFTDPQGPLSYFFSGRSQGLALDPVAFEQPKPPGTLRVLWVGESAAKGIPQPRHLRASAMLQAMLSDLLPGRRVEVINAGTPGIASYAVRGILKEGLAHEPDLVVIYLGNNEFYGAYGVASLHTAGRSPAMIRLTRAVRSTAIAQAIDDALHGRVVVEPRSLMEAMVGRSCIGPDDPARRQAAHNLRTFVGEMVTMCRARGVPVVVCTPPANEAGLAPLGMPDLSGLSEADRQAVERDLAAARGADLAEAERAVRRALELQPDHAHGHYLLGRALLLQGRAGAAEHFQRAVDLDPMPWRPPAASVEAIRRAAVESGARLADLEAEFRSASEQGAVGWDLIDDHVHPSLKGQALAARTVARAMSGASAAWSFSAGEVDGLPGWEVYARRCGANVFDEYAVADAMRRFGRLELFARSNPELAARNERRCGEIEAGAHPVVAARLRRWSDPATGLADRYPVTATVAEAMGELGALGEQARCYEVAARAEAPYSALRTAYLYLGLQARLRAEGSLDEEGRAALGAAVAEGEFLVGQGRTTSGQTPLFVGLLRQMRGEFEASIPMLRTARRELSGERRAVCEGALAEALRRSGRAGEVEGERARAAAEEPD